MGLDQSSGTTAPVTPSSNTVNRTLDTPRASPGDASLALWPVPDENISPSDFSQLSSGTTLDDQAIQIPPVRGASSPRPEGRSYHEIVDACDDSEESHGPEEASTAPVLRLTKTRLQMSAEMRAEMPTKTRPSMTPKELTSDRTKNRAGVSRAEGDEAAERNGGGEDTAFVGYVRERPEDDAPASSWGWKRQRRHSLEGSTHTSGEVDRPVRLTTNRSVRRTRDRSVGIRSSRSPRVVPCPTDKDEIGVLDAGRDGLDRGATEGVDDIPFDKDENEVPRDKMNGHNIQGQGVVGGWQEPQEMNSRSSGVLFKVGKVMSSDGGGSDRVGAKRGLEDPRNGGLMHELAGGQGGGGLDKPLNAEAESFRAVGITGHEDFDEMFVMLRRLKWKWGPLVHALASDYYIMKPGTRVKTGKLGEDMFESKDSVLRYVRRLLWESPQSTDAPRDMPETCSTMGPEPEAEHVEERATCVKQDDRRHQAKGKRGSRANLKPRPVDDAKANDGNDRETEPCAGSEEPKQEPRGETRLEKIERALQSLSPSSAPRHLKQRQKEFDEILSFIVKSVRSRKGGSIYLCGCPGTGKTQTISNVRAEVLRMAQEVRA